MNLLHIPADSYIIVNIQGLFWYMQPYAFIYAINLILGGTALDVRDVMRVLDAELICGEDSLDTEVHEACGSDMMSDVLAYVKDQAVLLTGLVNIQTVRTADMMDMVCIVFVRGKKPDEDMIALAKRRGMVLLRTDHRMFTACGLLWENGLRGGKSV